MLSLFNVKLFADKSKPMTSARIKSYTTELYPFTILTSFMLFSLSIEQTLLFYFKDIKDKNVICEKSTTYSAETAMVFIETGMYVYFQITFTFCPRQKLIRKN